MKSSIIKWTLARLPLPMLALAASYGVYSYASLFVPLWVAVVQAAAFEMTYLGLAVQDLDGTQRKRASAISIGAVAVSIIYNTLAGLFHRNPEWLHAWGAAWEWALAVLHGAPLAWVAYLVADLLLHSQTAPTTERLTAPAVELSFARLAEQPIYAAPVAVDEDALLATPAARTPACPHCGAGLKSWGAAGAAKRHGHCPSCK